MRALCWLLGHAFYIRVWGGERPGEAIETDRHCGRCGMSRDHRIESPGDSAARLRLYAYKTMLGR